MQLFCDDLTATQIAEISGVSRVTINNYFKLIRNRIATYCKENKTHIINAGAGSSIDEPVYYGFSVVNNKVQTHWLNNIHAGHVQQLQDMKPGGTISESLLPGSEGLQAMADCTNWNLYWISSGLQKPFAQAEHLSDINSFWQYTKGRLLKFRGMSRKTLCLHIKECEFRYNFRDEELYPALMNIISTNETVTDFSGAYSLAL